MTRQRKSEWITDKEKKAILAAYDALPCGPGGGHLKGGVMDIADFFRVTAWYVKALVRKRKLGKL